METGVICFTAILCSIILAGGINRAAFYLSKAIEAWASAIEMRTMFDAAEGIVAEMRRIETKKTSDHSTIEAQDRFRRRKHEN